MRRPRSDTACSSLANLADRPHIAATASNVAGSPLFNLINAIMYAHTAGRDRVFPSSFFPLPPALRVRAALMAGAVALLPRAPKCSVTYSSLHDATAPVLSMEFPIRLHQCMAWLLPRSIKHQTTFHVLGSCFSRCNRKLHANFVAITEYSSMCWSSQSRRQNTLQLTLFLRSCCCKPLLASHMWGSCKSTWHWFPASNV